MNLAPRLSTCSLAAGPHVGRSDDGAEAARRRDRLQAGDAGAHDEHARRRHGAGCGHHHRQRPAVFGGGIDHGAIAGEIGLARQHVHALRAGDARQELHREADDAGVGHGAQRGLVAVGVHDGDDHRALLVARQLRGLRTAHLEHDVGTLDRRGINGGAGGGIVRVEDARLDSSARLDRDLGAEADQFLDRLRRGGNPRLARLGFRSNRNLHSASDGGLRARPAFKPVRSRLRAGPSPAACDRAVELRRGKTPSG